MEKLISAHAVLAKLAFFHVRDRFIAVGTEAMQWQMAKSGKRGDLRRRRLDLQGHPALVADCELSWVPGLALAGWAPSRSFRIATTTPHDQ